MLMYLKQERDHGTPARTSTDTVQLNIDGYDVSVPKGTSLMRAAVEAGIQVPKLCATDSLEPFGSCRLCLVEIEGRKGFPASCTTPAEAGMVVRTQTPKLQDLRKGVMELYISDHPLDCLTCSANGNCELQDMAGVTGLRNVRYGVGAAAGAHHCDAKKTSPTRISPMTPANALCATAACVLVKKHKAPSHSPFQVAGLKAASHPVKTNPSWTANACLAVLVSKPAPPPLCKKNPSSSWASPSTA